MRKPKDDTICVSDVRNVSESLRSLRHVRVIEGGGDFVNLRGRLREPLIILFKSKIYFDPFDHRSNVLKTSMKPLINFSGPECCCDCGLGPCNTRIGSDTFCPRPHSAANGGAINNIEKWSETQQSVDKTKH